VITDRSLYLLGSSARQHSLVAPGLCGAWFAGSGPSRYGDFTLNYNFQAIFYGAYSTNHADSAMPYYRAILDYANGPGLVDAAKYNCR
jgi:alpha-L-fucosidase 2